MHSIVKSELFYKKYNIYLDNLEKTSDFVIQSYLKIVKDIKYETIKLISTWQYSSKSCLDVYNKAYDILIVI